MMSSSDSDIKTAEIKKIEFFADLLKAKVTGVIDTETYKQTIAAYHAFALSATASELPHAPPLIAGPQLMPDTSAGATSENENRNVVDSSARFRVTVTHPCKRSDKITAFEPPINFLLFVSALADTAELHREALAQIKQSLSHPKHANLQGTLDGLNRLNTCLYSEDREVSRTVSNPRGGRRVRQWKLVEAGPDHSFENIKSFSARTEEIALCVLSWHPEMTYRPRQKRKRAQSTSDTINTNETNTVNSSDPTDRPTQLVATAATLNAAAMSLEDGHSNNDSANDMRTAASKSMRQKQKNHRPQTSVRHAR